MKLRLLSARPALLARAEKAGRDALKMAGDNEALTIRTHRALARLFEQLGDAGRANQHYRASALAMNVD